MPAPLDSKEVGLPLTPVTSLFGSNRLLPHGSRGLAFIKVAFLQLEIERQTSDFVGENFEAGGCAGLQRVLVLTIDS